ncbi:MAG: aldo/keto reductase [Dysgonamonadaceae bacterium]|jgi:diketogulonate reductase-like aldo/keto reductase/flavodoxin|nr:aldo/keto reductase [Dysgonamonadaceae bacterium]
MRKVMFFILLMAGIPLTLGTCSPKDDSVNTETPPAPNPDPDPDNPQPDNGRFLVLYFSRSGNTRAVANEIKTQTDGTILEVTPTTAYPSDYNATLSRAQQEISAIDNNGSYPSINTAVENFNGYDIIFICTPLWYTRMATPMQSFLNAHSQKLANKRVALAVTSTSSGISSVVADAGRLCSGSTFAGEALWVRSSQLGSVRETVATWLGTLDLNLNQNNVSSFDLSKGENGKAPTVRLSSGYDMPIVGLRTYSLHGNVCVNSVIAAIRRGFRKLDTAHMYGNEEEVGQGVRESGVPREEIFVATKLYSNQYSNPEAAIEGCLRKLDIGYLDLMLLHHPGANDVKAYKAIEKYVAQGKIRSIGLSNYYIREMSAFLPQVTVKPVLVQNEIHPYYQDTDVINYMHEQGIVVEAWYPLGGRGHTAALFNDPVIAGIAAAHGKSSAQVILRWDLQKGVVVIPGSSNPDHIEENISIFDFELTDEEMSRINALNRNEKHDWY